MAFGKLWQLFAGSVTIPTQLNSLSKNDATDEFFDMQKIGNA